VNLLRRGRLVRAITDSIANLLLHGVVLRHVRVVVKRASSTLEWIAFRRRRECQLFSVRIPRDLVRRHIISRWNIGKRREDPNIIILVVVIILGRCVVGKQH